MGVRRKWAFVGVAVLAFFVVAFLIASNQDEGNAERRRQGDAADRRTLAATLQGGIPGSTVRTEGTEDEGLVLAPCTDASLLHVIADRETRDALRKYDFAWIRCRDGQPMSGRGLWWNAE